jgi:hypothetical protein
VQTFLPYADFDRSAAVLDSPRLGKQRVETLQVLRALELPEYGWVNHPVVRMWRGFTPALVAYGIACLVEWQRRGHADSTRPLIEEFAPGADRQTLERIGQLPPWLGDERLHRSHRAALVRKDPDFYRPVLGDVDEPADYWWPGGPDAVPRPVDGSPLWVVRPVTAAAHDALLLEGLVGLGAESGIDVDASGPGAGSLRELLAVRAPGRRPGKDLRQLHSLLHEVGAGHPVGLLHPERGDLTVGVVEGDYAYVPPAEGAGPTGDALPHHRRAVRWTGRLPRSAVGRPATLQDPRRLFRVGVDESRLRRALAAAPVLPSVLRSAADGAPVG